MWIEVRKKDETQLAVKMPYDAAALAKVKQIPGRRWDGEAREWTFPYTYGNAELFLRLFQGYAVSTDAALADDPLLGEFVRRSAVAAGEGAIDLLVEEMRLSGFSRNTIRNYRLHAERFLRWAERPIAEISQDDVRRYLLELMALGLSHAYVKQAISALRFWASRRKRPDWVESLPAPRKDRKLPEVMSQEEVLRLLRTVTNRKHAALLQLVYSSGLRVGEVVKLRVRDLEIERGLIRVRQGKGRKDRYTLLGEAALRALRAYARDEKPTDWLFPGAREGRHLTIRAAQKVFELARDRAGIRRPVSIHTICVIPSRRTCSSTAPTCGTSKPCSATAARKRPKSIPTSANETYAASRTRWIGCWSKKAREIRRKVDRVPAGLSAVDLIEIVRLGDGDAVIPIE